MRNAKDLAAALAAHRQKPQEIADAIWFAAFCKATEILETYDTKDLAQDLITGSKPMTEESVKEWLDDKYETEDDDEVVAWINEMIKQYA